MSSSIVNLLQTLRIIPTTEVKGDGQQPVTASNQQKPSTMTMTTISTSTAATTTITNVKNSKFKALPEICLQTVALHDDYRDCWIVIYDRVYNVTNFLNDHPGGADIIMDYAGRDATLAFHDTAHSSDAIKQMQDYLIGELPYNERIFRCKERQVLSKGIPD